MRLRARTPSHQVSLPLRARAQSRAQTRIRAHAQTRSRTRAGMRLHEIEHAAPMPAPRSVPIFAGPPVVCDILSTVTSQAQDAVMGDCMALLADGAEPRLDRARHVRFLRGFLDGLSAGYVSADASRPWFLYWLLSALHLLGEDVAALRPRLVETVRPMQNRGGGFGGGFGQISHIATTYSVMLALALVGGADAYNLIDRRALWHWLCQLKCPDGGFRMCLGGEEDIRGAYCAIVIITLLRLPVDLDPASAVAQRGLTTLYAGLAEYVSRCQTYEGGISAMPDTEAHGAYAFCALGCLSLLGSPSKTIPRYLDVPRLVAWLSSRQYAPEGGLSGRTNKLVDGCYSHWVGGCWPLIEACLSGAASSGLREAQDQRLVATQESLFSRECLIRYILCCCQDVSKRGGLRDKPGKPSDPYHSCYTLLGLSAAQHKWIKEEGSEPSTWIEFPRPEGMQIFDNADFVPSMHPLYAIPHSCVDGMRDYYAQLPGF